MIRPSATHTSLPRKAILMIAVYIMFSMTTLGAFNRNSPVESWPYGTTTDPYVKITAYNSPPAPSIFTSKHRGLPPELNNKQVMFLGTWHFELTGTSDVSKFQLWGQNSGYYDWSNGSPWNGRVTVTTKPGHQVTPNDIYTANFYYIYYDENQGRTVARKTDWSIGTNPSDNRGRIPELPLIISPNETKYLAIQLILVLEDKKLPAGSPAFIYVGAPPEVTWNLWGRWQAQPITPAPQTYNEEGIHKPMLDIESVVPADNLPEHPKVVYNEEIETIIIDDKNTIYTFHADAIEPTIRLENFLENYSIPQPVAHASILINSGTKPQYAVKLSFNPSDFEFNRTGTGMKHPIRYQLFFNDPVRGLTQITPAQKAFIWSNLGKDSTTYFYDMLWLGNVSLEDYHTAPAGDYQSIITITVTPEDSI